MFREMRRFKQRLPVAACRELLKNEKRAVLSVIGDDGYPYGVPVDYIYDETENAIYIHCARSGHKSDAIAACDKVCFTVWGNDHHKEGHWEWNVYSVIVFGRARDIEDKAQIAARLRELASKYYPDPAEAEAELAGNVIDRVRVYRIDIEHMTGKDVNEK